jgi:hypothetical protein
MPVNTGGPLTISIAGLGPVRVQPFVQRTTTVRQCGANIRVGERPVQRLTTLGVGETETESCGTLLAVGAVPAPAGEYRIAFLYRDAPQHAGAKASETFIRAIIVHRSARAAVWTVDDALSASLDSVRSIAGLRAQLKHGALLRH